MDTANVSQNTTNVNIENIPETCTLFSLTKIAIVIFV